MKHVTLGVACAWTLATAACLDAGEDLVDGSPDVVENDGETGPSCEPTCRSGFGCIAGECRSCCNPGCATGESCACGDPDGCLSGARCTGSWICVASPDGGDADGIDGGDESDGIPDGSDDEGWDDGVDGVDEAPSEDIADAADDGGETWDPASEDTPGIADCDECGAGAGWGTARFAYRGVCSYSNGTTVGLEPCHGDVLTHDGQTPLTCGRDEDGNLRAATSYGSSYLGWAFQCVEYARRVTKSRAPAWSSIMGNACQWWERAAGRPDVVQRQNGESADPPRPDDLLVFRTGSACSDTSPGHIGVVVRVDPTAGRLWMADQNRQSGGLLELTYGASGGSYSVSNFGGGGATFTVLGWLSVGSADTSCGVRRVFPAASGALAEQLVTCPPGSWCDADASACRPNGDCAACPEGARCAGGLCVCDPAERVSATSFVFDESTRCFAPGPYVAGVDGCSATMAIKSDPETRRAMYLRDFDVEDPQIISPHLDWTIDPGYAIEVEMACRGVSGVDAAQAKVYLSRDGTSPAFAEGAMASPRVPLTCDGTTRRVRFEFPVVAAGTAIGWMRLDPLDAEPRFAAAEVWIRSVDLVRAAGSCGAPGEPCCPATPSCNVGLSCVIGICQAIPCSDDCLVAGATRCLGATTQQRCGSSYDADDCLEWGGDVTCPTACVVDRCTTCTSECTLGERRCAGGLSYETCADRDGDGCFEFGGLPRSCDVGTECTGAGTCTPCAYNFCEASGYDSGTICDGSSSVTCGTSLSGACAIEVSRRSCSPGTCIGGSCTSCSPGTSRGCTTTCGSAGTETCQPSGTWGSCQPPLETCNGADDDCDSATDDGFTCPMGSNRTCTSVCGSGTQTCTSACTWGTCSAPTSCCTDADGDGVGVGASCSGPTDCDDGNRWVYPGAPELCDFTDNNCSAGGTDSGCRVRSTRYRECTSHHWTSNLEGTGPFCAPYPAAPNAGCSINGCSLGSCGGTSCWVAETSVSTASFTTYRVQEGALTGLVRLYHWNEPGTLRNRYTTTPTAPSGHVAGMPADLGLIATTPSGPSGVTSLPLIECRWTPGVGGTDYFLSTSESECTAAAGVVNARLGYVWSL